MHGKFYDIDENGEEPCVPVRGILKVFVGAGYQGYISSEWEGWHWNSEGDATVMIKKQHALLERVLPERVPA